MLTSAFIFAALASIAATGLVLRYARIRLIDQVNERSSHTVPTPRGGGLGMVLAAVTVWLFCSFQPAWARIPVVAGCMLAMAAMGWWDDHSGLPARFRFVVQFVLVALALVIIGLPAVFRIGSWEAQVSPLLLGPIMVIGGVWMVNLTNFMDGIDGLAGSQGVVAGAAAGILLTATGDADWRLLGWSLSGACFGFLWWNRPPARIFMGDVGSTTLGMVFAIFIFVQLHAGIALDVAVLPVFPFVADATGTLLRRLWRREHLFQAHRSHLYQRLARHWGCHLPVTMVLSTLAILGAFGAWATQRGMLPPLLAFFLCLVVFIALTLYGRNRVPT